MNYQAGYQINDTKPLSGAGYGARGQTFKTPNDGISHTLDSVVMYIYRPATDTFTNGEMRVRIYAHTGTFGSTGKPTGSALASSDAVDPNDVDTSYELFTFTFTGANRILLSPNTAYCVALEGVAGFDGSHRIYMGGQSVGESHWGNFFDFISTGWRNLSIIDGIFYVYAEPLSSLGETTILGDEASIDNRLYALKVTAPENGLAIAIFYALRANTTIVKDHVGGIYLSDTSLYATCTPKVNDTHYSYYQWKFTVFASPPEITSGSQYLLAINCEGATPNSTYIAYNPTGGGPTYYRVNGYSGSLPDPIGASNYTWNVSIYCMYEPEAPTGTPMSIVPLFNVLGFMFLKDKLTGLIKIISIKKMLKTFSTGFINIHEVWKMAKPIPSKYGGI
jgi:hypothetical protein